jgi:hypothetical protein
MATKAETKKITMFDRATLDAVEGDVLAELANFAKQRGLALKFAGGSYSDTQFTSKLVFTVTAADGEVLSQERMAFKKYADVYGLNSGWLDESFVHAGSNYTIIGFNLKSRVRPIVTRDDKGRETHFPIDMVKAAIAPEGYLAEQMKRQERERQVAAISGKVQSTEQLATSSATNLMPPEVGQGG